MRAWSTRQCVYLYSVARSSLPSTVHAVAICRYVLKSWKYEGNETGVSCKVTGDRACVSFSIFKSEANSSMKCENLYENCCLFFLQIRQSIESHYENTQMFLSLYGYYFYVGDLQITCSDEK